jgi:DNA-binding MarR family transcriptional regulator
MTRLQKEIQQSKPFVSARIEAYLALQRTTDLASRPVEKVFSRWGLTPEQYNVLRILRGAEPKGLPTLEIGRRMITRASNVTRIIDRLESKKLVDRKRETQDRRVVRIRISGEGLRLLSEMQDSVSEASEVSIAGLTEPEAQRLVNLLEKIREGLSAVSSDE